MLNRPIRKPHPNPHDGFRLGEADNLGMMIAIIIRESDVIDAEERELHRHAMAGDRVEVRDEQKNKEDAAATARPSHVNAKPIQD